MDDNKYAWIAFYMEFADVLAQYRDNREELKSIIKTVYKNIGIKMPKLDADNQLIDIDPFTVFGLFNKGITEKHRKAIISEFKQLMNLQEPVPDTFDGIPILNNLNATFYKFINDNRGEHDIDELWDVYIAALKYADDSTGKNKKQFIQTYNQVKNFKYNGWKLTIGLYWIRPNKYVNLDGKNRSFIESSGVLNNEISKAVSNLTGIPEASTYLNICERLADDIAANSYAFSSFPELSYEAWFYSNKDEDEDCFWPSLKDYDPGISKKTWKLSTQDRRYHLFDDPSKFTLIPDIVLTRDDGSVIVLDTKWKSLIDDPSKNYGISQPDMYQMYVYGKKYKTSEIWLLYPVNEQMRDHEPISFKSEDNINVYLYFVDVANIKECLQNLSFKIENTVIN